MGHNKSQVLLSGPVQTYKTKKPALGELFGQTLESIKEVKSPANQAIMSDVEILS